MNIEWYPGQKALLSRQVQKALEMTAEEVRRDLRASHTLPRRTGQLTEQTFIDRTRSWQGVVSVVTSTPYARRLYFHPEYNFYQGINEAAGGEWFRPYLKGGRKQDFTRRTYSKFLRTLRGV